MNKKAFHRTEKIRIKFEEQNPVPWYLEYNSFLNQYFALDHVRSTKGQNSYNSKWEEFQDAYY